MGEQVRVHDDGAIRQARAALAEYAEQVRLAIDSADAEVERVSRWLTQELPPRCAREVRELEERVAHAKAEIMRKRIVAAPEPASVALEQKALRQAEDRLERARARQARVRHWGVQWAREAPMYKSACRTLLERSQRDVPEAMKRMSAMLDAIDAYQKVRPAAAPSPQAPAAAETEAPGEPR